MNQKADNNLNNTNKRHQQTLFSALAGILLGTIITLIIVTWLAEPAKLNDNIQATETSTQQKPLYWVAPMDANYRRDKPGKSPMGMDLIPFYGNQVSHDNDEGPGTIKISPSVVNNLGVRTSTVRYKTLNTTIETVGYVTYDEDRLVHIHPRIAGWIEKLHINAIGDPITKGQPLYDIYSPELVNAQEELLLALARKNDRLIVAAENRLIALQLPKYSIMALKQHKKVQQNVTFYAPQDGVVESLFIREGFYVKPETMLLSIVDLSRVWVKAEVFERDVFKTSVGDNAIMRLDYLPAKTWQGRVDHIHPMLNTKTRTGIVRMHFDNQSGELKPNMFAQISIDINDDKPVLQVPREAVIRTGNQNRVVLALGNGYFKSVAVKLGRSDRDNIEILSGVSDGEKVVSSAQFLLDSESSKSSDFKRMHIEQHQHHRTEPTSDLTEQFPSAMVHGTVTSVMAEHRMVTIDREAITKWNREAASVDFIVADNVDMTLFTPDAYLMFTFIIRDGDFIIINAMTMNKADHSAMDHSMHNAMEANQ